MKAEAQDFDEISALAVEVAALELFAVLSGHYAGMHGGKPLWVKRVQAILDERKSVSIGALVQDAGVHPMTLMRGFRRHLGTSPAQYLRRVRAQAAARLLARSRLSLEEIADQAGYSNPSVFTKAFRRATGRGPSQFRRLWT